MDTLFLATLGDMLVRGCVEQPERTALVIDDRRWTYAQLHERAVATARSLRGLGVRKGDHVAVFMPNCIEFLEVLFGATYLGAVTVPINARFRIEELRHVVPDSGARVVLVNSTGEAASEHLDRLRDAFPAIDDAPVPDADTPEVLQLDAAPTLRAVVAFGHESAPGVLGAKAFAALGDGVPADEVDHQRRRVALRDVAMMFYTSGTTSNPKGCPLTHEALVRTGVTTRQRFGYRDGDVMFDPLPMFHTASTQPMIATLDALGTFVTMTHFEPTAALRLIAEEGVTVMFTAFPTITEALLNHPDYDPERTFVRVRSVFNVSAPDHLRSMQARMPHSTLVNAFGMTEFAGSVTMVDPAETLDLRVTQGLPLPGIEIEIRDPFGDPLPPGEMGEIVIRGPTMFEGYHNDPEKSAATIEPEGWWHSGDLGVLRPDGRLEFKGRMKDMLKVGGENVAAIEIESHLQSHPAVNIAQVVGVPDPKYGEVPAAFIELRPGATATAEELIAPCQGRIASFKVPRYIRFVTEWPMSSTKVQKYKLREQLHAELGLTSS